MFNPHRVRELLKDSNTPIRNLLEYLGKNHNGSITQLLSSDMKASVLEKMADFFGVPVDEFFDRRNVQPMVKVDGVKNHVHHFSVGAKGNVDIDVYNKLIEEKDKRIAILEELVALYKAKSETGQNSDK